MVKLNFLASLATVTLTPPSFTGRPRDSSLHSLPFNGRPRDSCLRDFCFLLLLVTLDYTIAIARLVIESIDLLNINFFLTILCKLIFSLRFFVAVAIVASSLITDILVNFGFLPLPLGKRVSTVEY
uniref:Uncharacterized protein n=1 Tax=Strigamia maritima TaxID=126957 RepID=T1IYS0_STRMM